MSSLHALTQIKFMNFILFTSLFFKKKSKKLSFQLRQNDKLSNQELMVVNMSL